MIFLILPLVFALIGFSVCAYIHHKKTAREVLVCPIGSDCTAVVHSQYSVFFGIPLEILGMCYYTGIAFFYGLNIIDPTAFPSFFFFLVFLATTAALIFSVYLTVLQLGVLKQICVWCLGSATISAGIFAVTFAGLPGGFIDFLIFARPLIIAIHAFGFIMGVGGAIFSDIFFFKFLRDFKISEFESDVLRVFSQIIWAALAVLILTGIGLYLPESAQLIQSPKFLAKMLIVGIIIINGIFLNYFISPKLIQISFGGRHMHHAGELHRLQRIAFASGAVSLTSWIWAFGLGVSQSVPFSFAAIAASYAICLALAITISQIAERQLR